MHLPQRNPFIPTDFELSTRDGIDGAAGKVPAVIKDAPLTRLWFKQDDEYLLPKACINFEIMSPLAYVDPSHANLNYLFVQLFRDDINENLYPAGLAGLNYSISNTKYGVNVGVGGYHDKQKILLEKIFSQFSKYQVNEDRFKVLKEAYVRGLKNFKTEQPHAHASYNNNLLLGQRVWTKEELLDSVEDICPSKLQEFIPRLFANIHIECLMFGNLTGIRSVFVIAICT